ncbi:CatB-related O-acetyltransferase [Paralimibaculum aggregatum]|uniref:CatB-related O-acetyltransferase n=1 Tax=Paralimibaculum aggregatum TaxID=3036245 RepID=A0ABQ6LFW8_9RHOB|nr:CatB-related O-acetyltransferase [Limibaculum sp. NKW23]GMG80934.1 CatB-related O-acetyltransferase [Limibaculum sp. NKW23]
MSGLPDPAALFPLPEVRSVVHLAPLAEGRENVEAGAFSYYSSPREPERFFETQVLYHWPFVGDRLAIGRFCALAEGVRFLMDGGNHLTDGFSTYPFEIHGGAWAAGFDGSRYDRQRAAKRRGETRLGHDVWLGHGATVLAGSRIGSGAVIGAGAVVAGEIPPYAVAVGNPARVVRRRFDADTTARLLALAWWDWPVARIAAALPAIRGADIAALEAAGEAT